MIEEARCFFCPECGETQDMYYFYEQITEETEPDRICCEGCGAIYWWSYTQKKLYCEKTQIAVNSEHFVEF